MLAPQPLKTLPYAVHTHYWRVAIVYDRALGDIVVATCQCGAELTQEQVEGLLNGRQYEFEGGMLEGMGMKGEAIDAEPQIDRAAELQEVWSTELGQLWQLGEGLGKRYRFQHEFIIYACKDKAPFYGDRSQSDVWEMDIKKTTEHNTPKPVELPQKAISNSSQNGAIMFDGCCGHGTTIIAAHNLNRRCYAMEISPNYGAVILQRYQDATGITPELDTVENQRK